MFTIAGRKTPVLRDPVDLSLKILKTYLWQLPKHKKNHPELLHTEKHALIVIFTPLDI